MEEADPHNVLPPHPRALKETVEPHPILVSQLLSVCSIAGIVTILLNLNRSLYCLPSVAVIKL